MKTILCFTFAFMMCGAFGATVEEELPALLALCDNDDFDTREQATIKLSEFPAEYVDKFLNMAEKETNQEVRYRLKAAARGIFEKKVGCSDPRWLYFHGTLFLNGNVLWQTKDSLDTEAPYWHRECTIIGLLVEWVNDLDGPCKGKIRQMDIILSVDGGLNPINVKAGCDYVVRVRRFKNTKYIEDHNAPDPEATDKDYDEFDVTVTAAWQERRFVNEQAELELMNKLWNEYLDSRNKQ